MSQSIAIVIPVYREEKVLPMLYERLKIVTEKLPEFDWCYFFVNDGSPDYSLDVLIKIAENDHRVKVIDLSRNFGKEIALSAGVHEASNINKPP